MNNFIEAFKVVFSLGLYEPKYDNDNEDYFMKGYNNGIEVTELNSVSKHDFDMLQIEADTNFAKGRNHAMKELLEYGKSVKEIYSNGFEDGVKSIEPHAIVSKLGMGNMAEKMTISGGVHAEQLKNTLKKEEDFTREFKKISEAEQGISLGRNLHEGFKEGLKNKTKGDDDMKVIAEIKLYRDEDTPAKNQGFYENYLQALNADCDIKVIPADNYVKIQAIEKQPEDEISYLVRNGISLNITSYDSLTGEVEFQELEGYTFQISEVNKQYRNF